MGPMDTTGGWGWDGADGYDRRLPPVQEGPQSTNWISYSPQSTNWISYSPPYLEKHLALPLWYLPLAYALLCPTRCSLCHDGSLAFVRSEL